ncbi:MAG TPA: lysophospholipase [Bacillota bacterium]|nr:lysophospholipase [Bacillota bacterium]
MRTYTKFYSADKDDKPPILLVHGAGEHLDRYLWVVNKWNEAGFSVLGGDLPGYGRSEGKKGHIDHFDDYIQAIDSWYEELRKYSNHRPFLFGHSLGGLVVARFMEERRREVTGVILSSPCFALAMEVPSWKGWIAKALNKIYPSLVLSAGIKPHYVSRNKEITEKYRMDPLVTKGASVRWYTELVSTMEANYEQLSLFPQVSLLIHQAGSDYVVSAQKVRQWFESVPLKDKTYRDWPELYHEILNEPEREEVIAEMIKWMIMHTNKLSSE